MDEIICNEVFEVAGYITPVPGGVGPITIAKLMENVVVVKTQNNILVKNKF